MLVLNQPKEQVTLDGTIENNIDQPEPFGNEDEWNLMLESESNQESVESGKKRGKYKVYTSAEKATILNFVSLGFYLKTYLIR